MTKNDIISRLTELGIEHDVSAKKADLMELMPKGEQEDDEVARPLPILGVVAFTGTEACPDEITFRGVAFPTEEPVEITNAALLQKVSALPYFIAVSQDA